jgi:uncharacterized protein YcbK (DUF882 family)
VGTRARALLVTGAAVAALGSYAIDLGAQMPSSRTISLRNIHTDEVITVEYKRNGRNVPEAMEQINWILRDWRRNEPTQMDPALIDLIWEMHRELGSKEPVNIISGYRSRTTNEMLRRTVGGQASESRHILGKAADIQFPDVPLKHMRYAAMVRERGGVGYYPTSATPFVHVDTDRVRAWPRMPRYELALLFPNARTQHKPAEGGDLTAEDVRAAKARHADAAVEVASFQELRRRPREQPSVMAALAPGAEPVFTPGPAVAGIVMTQAPQLVAEPQIVDRPSRLAARPSDDDRRKLTQLVALAAVPHLVGEPEPAPRVRFSGPQDQPPTMEGREPIEKPQDKERAEGLLSRLAFLSAVAKQSLTGLATVFTKAPEWDEDHPEEAAYRPFPLAPFLTETASIDDPALVRLTHPDLSRTAELFDTSGVAEPMRLRPGRHIAHLMWSEEGGSGSNVDQLGATADGESRPVAARRVQTELAR